jgi:Protein of unknown function (DUF3489)
LLALRPEGSVHPIPTALVPSIRTEITVAKSKKSPARAAAHGTKRRGTKGRPAAQVRHKGAKPGAKRQSATAKSTKIASMTVMLCRIKGVSIGELCEHTGWQPHSVRAVISSVMKKKLGLDVVSEKLDGVRIYRVVV